MCWTCRGMARVKRTWSRRSASIATPARRLRSSPNPVGTCREQRAMPSIKVAGHCREIPNIKKEAAQREVDILMDGRNLGP